MKAVKAVAVVLISFHAVSGQTLFVPNSTGGGIDDSPNSNVGVATDNPQEKLHINGSLGIGKFSDNSKAGLTISYTDGGAGTTVFKQNRWGGHYYFKRDGSQGERTQLYFGGSGGGNEMSLYDANDEVKIRFHSNASSFFNGGNFGIGTTSPQANLHVSVGNSGQTPTNVTGLFVESNGVANNWYAFQTASVGGGKSFSITNAGNVGVGVVVPEARLDIKSTGDGSNLLRFSTDRAWVFQQQGTGPETALVLKSLVASKYFKIQDASGEDAFRIISSSGNSYFKGSMAIGTTTPDAKLTVKGTVHAEEVKVDLSVPGPDYVFEKDYPLATLEEVKKYIDEHKHLPEVPSAREMEENGVKVGEMNMILLKKVEELTLYTIELERKNAELVERLLEMDQRISSLEGRPANGRSREVGKKRRKMKI